MGGLGSGRPSGWGRNKVEASRSIDVNELHRAGCLRPGWQGTWRWSRNGENVAAIGIRADQERLHLDYRVRPHDGEWQDVTQTVHFVSVPCRYGGERPYFLCPGNLGDNPCGRRVTKLYGAGRYFLCRHCYQLTYASQCEDRLMRLRRKALKAAARLDPRASSWVDVQRPKGMWRRTYDRLHRQAFELEWDADELFDSRCVQINEQIEKKSKTRPP